MISASEAFGQNGADLERFVSAICPGFKLTTLLEDHYLLDTDTARSIESRVSVAEVACTSAGALALDATSLLKSDDESSTPISRAMFPKDTAIVISNKLTESFAQAVHQNGVFKTCEEQKKHAGIVAAVFELGRVVNKHLYKRLPEAVPSGEASDFFIRITDDLAARDLTIAVNTDRLSNNAAEHYYQEALLPERFYSAGGLDLVSRVYPFLGTNALAGALRSRAYDFMEATGDTLLQMYRLPWEDIAAAHPLPKDNYLDLRSQLSNPSNVVPFR